MLLKQGVLLLGHIPTSLHAVYGYNRTGREYVRMHERQGKTAMDTDTRGVE